MENFNSEKVVQECTSWIRKYAKETNMEKVAIGISGGKDSTIAAMLCCEALGRHKVVGVLMPNGYQSDISDSYKICEALGIESHELDINHTYESIIDLLENDLCPSAEARINIGPRIRMTLLYTIAQSIGARVCGTGNLSEIKIGYCTKWGDMACDFNPLGNLTSLEVVAVGLELADKHNIDESLILKKPADGLCGMTDEERLGVTYEEIHNYIRGLEMDLISFNKIHEMTQKAKHKLIDTPMFKWKCE